MDNQCYTALHAAVLVDDRHAVETILSRFDIDLNTRLHNGKTIIYAAAMDNRVDLVRILLSKGGDRVVNDVGEALVLAAEKGYHEVIHALMGATIRKISCITALQVAADKGHYDAVKALLACGVDPNCTTYFNETPLYSAAKNGRLDIVEMLVSSGSTYNTDDRNRPSPLQAAVERGHLDIVKFLANAFGLVGNDLVASAAYRSHLHVLKYLIERDMDVNAHNTYNESPLYCAVRTGDMEAVRLLVESGARVDNPQGMFENRPVHAAVRQPKIDVLKYFVEQCGVDIHVVCVDGKTPLHHATLIERPTSVAYLVDRGGKALCDVQDRSGETALHIALDRRYLESAKILARHTDVTLADNNGRTLLTTARNNRLRDVELILLARGAQQ